MPPRIPTELDLLSEIYDRHYRDYAAYSDENKTRSAKIWMPIDIEALAKRFRVDADILFGMLYYHMNDKHGGKDSQGEATPFFLSRLGQDRHCVNFPLLASVLAARQDERGRHRTATGIAALSLVVSGVSILVAVFA